MLMMIDTRVCCAHIHEHCITQLLKQAATRVHQACTTARTNRMYTRFATLYPPRKAYTVEFCRAARNLSDRPLLYSSAKADTATCFKCSVLYNAWLLFRNGHSMQHYHLLCGHPQGRKYTGARNAHGVLTRGSAYQPPTMGAADLPRV